MDIVSFEITACSLLRLEIKVEMGRLRQTKTLPESAERSLLKINLLKPKTYFMYREL